VQLARVIGTVVATRKNELLVGAKLLLVHPIDPEGAPWGSAMLAVDSVGAGVGETVLTVHEGRAAGQALGRPGAPVDAAIVGIVDRMDGARGHDGTSDDRIDPEVVPGPAPRRRPKRSGPPTAEQ